MEKRGYVSQLKRISFLIIISILIQLIFPAFSNITFAASTDSGLKYESKSDGIHITGYTKKLGKTVKIPEKIKSKNVVAINADAFKGNKKITSVTIPKTVTKIGGAAFKDCEKLEKATISGSNLKSIGKKAFYNCKKLKSFSMPDSVTSLGESTFEDCDSLSSLKFSSALKTIPFRCVYSANRKKSKLKTLTIPKNVETIEHRAFNHCVELTKVVLEDGSKLKVIGSYSFSGCKSLKTMKEKSSTSDKDLKLPKTVFEIGQIAFADAKFETIVIPDKCKDLKEGVFEDCTKLKKVYYYGDDTNGKVEGKDFRIGAHTFHGCSNLEVVYATIEEVCDCSFYDCKKLKKLYLTPNCNFAGSSPETAFENCSNLKVYSRKKVSKDVKKAGAKENVIDTTAPKVKVSYSKTGATNKDVVVTIESTDGKLLKPKEGWKSTNGYKKLTKTYTSNINKKVDVYDFVENKTQVNVKITNIDKTAPKITISGTTGKKWKNKAQSVKVKATDKSGIKSLKIKKVGSSKEYKISGSSGTVKLNQYGKYKVEAIDKAGNKKTSSEFWNYVDTDKPTISNAKADSNGKITATAKDSTSSVEVKLIGNGKTYASKKPDKDGKVEFSVSTSGKYTLKAIDSAGNVKTQDVNVTISSSSSQESEVAQQEEESTKETQTEEVGNEDATVDESSVQDETSNGEEEQESTSGDEITQEGETEGSEEIQVEVDQACNINYNDTNNTAEIVKYIGTEDVLIIPETLEKDGKTYTITKIAKEAFKDTGIKSVQIPETVTQIEESAFENCIYLEKIIIKNPITQIGNNALKTNNAETIVYCGKDSSVQTYATTNSLKTGIYMKEGDYEYIIVDEEFSKTTLTSVDNGTGSTEDSEDVVETTEDTVTAEDVTETVAELIKCNSNSESIVIPNTVGSYKVSSIGERVFKGNTSIKQIELLDNMRKIKSQAFEKASNLQKVILRNDEISIAANSFKDTNPVVYCGYDSTGMEFARANSKQYVLINGAFIYQLNEDTLTADVLSATVGEGDPEYVTIEDTIGDYTIGKIKSGAFLNTKLKGVIIKNKTLPVENVDIEEGALEGSEFAKLYCFEGSTVDEYVKAHSNLGIQVAYLSENGEIMPENIEVSDEEISIKVGEEDSIYGVVYPSITTNTDLIYKSNDEKIVTVDETGKIKGINEGDTTIEITSKADNSKVATIKVKVSYINVVLNLEGGTININGKTQKDKCTIKVSYGYLAKDITNPTKAGYNFTGWYEKTEDEDANEDINWLEDSEDETITKDTELYAGWEEERITDRNAKPIDNGDATTANRILPYTGKAAIAVAIIVLIGTAAVIRIRIKKLY